MINVMTAVEIVEEAKKDMKVISGVEYKNYYSFGLAPKNWDGDDTTLPANSTAYCVDKNTGRFFEKHIIDVLMENDKGKELNIYQQIHLRPFENE